LGPGVQSEGVESSNYLIRKGYFHWETHVYPSEVGKIFPEVCRQVYILATQSLILDARKKEKEKVIHRKPERREKCEPIPYSRQNPNNFLEVGISHNHC